MLAVGKMRTFAGLKLRHAQFLKSGGDLKNASKYANVIEVVAPCSRRITYICMDSSMRLSLSLSLSLTLTLILSVSHSHSHSHSLSLSHTPSHTILSGNACYEMLEIRPPSQQHIYIWVTYIWVTFLK